MRRFKQLIASIIAIISCSYTIYVTKKLINFLTPIHNVPVAQTWIINLLDNKSKLETAFVAIIYDLLWISAFILQHSIMRTTICKSVWNKIGFDIIERAVYCIATCYCLSRLMQDWIPAPTITIWYFHVETYSAKWWFLAIIHTIAWLTIFAGVLMMDILELMGAKQVLYDIRGLSHPLNYKPREIRRLYNRARHPSFVCLMTIFWITNCMSLDRFIIASMLTLYMYIAWSTDKNDIAYQKWQIKSKQEELKNIAY